MYIFAGAAWNDTTFYPKKNIILKNNVAYIFALNECSNIKTRLKECGVILDLSGATTAEYAFYYAQTSELPVINLANCANNLSSTFGYARNLVSIDKLIISEKCRWNNTFNQCLILEHLIIEGTIGQNGFNVQHSTKLTADSLKSIIDALSTTTTGLTITLPTTAEANYNANPPENAPATWAELVATRSNWTIAYA
jgi:hypothetical protein